MMGIKRRVLAVLGLGSPPHPLDAHHRRCAAWLLLNHQHPVLDLEYDGLGPDSQLVDVGGNLGNWSSHWHSRTAAHVDIYEPVRQFAEKLRVRFRANSRIDVYEYGLGNRDRQEDIEVDGGASSYVAHLKKIPIDVESVMIRDARLAFARFDCIDLMGINIEGAEYELLPYLIESKLIQRIRHLQIQFHEFIPNAHEMRRRISEALSETHEKTYDYDWVWESWSRK